MATKQLDFKIFYLFISLEFILYGYYIIRSSHYNGKQNSSLNNLIYMF